MRELLVCIDFGLDRTRTGRFAEFIKHDRFEVAADATGLCAMGARGPHSAAVAARGEVTVALLGSLIVDGRVKQTNAAAAALDQYERHGENFLNELRGQFSLALFDRRASVAYFVTDLFATVPLYFVNVEQSVFAGTSLQKVREAACERPFHIDPQALYDYFYHQMIPSPRTIYREARKLGPAQALIVRANGSRIVDYRKLRFADEAPSGSGHHGERLAPMLKERLAQAVERVDSEGSVAGFLSGGIDSSTVCGLLAKRRPSSRIPAYTIGFAVEGYDEAIYAQISAKHFGLDLREHYLEPERLVELMPMVAQSYDEPFGNSSAAAVLLLAQRAKADGVTKLIAGDGGDELFGGNDRYAKQKVFQAYHSVPETLRRMAIEPLVTSGIWPKALMPFRKVTSYVEQARIPMPRRLETYNFLEMSSPREIFDRDFLAQVDMSAPLVGIESRYGSAPANSLVDRMLYLDWKITLADNDLRKVTQMCHVAGVDVAFPFLDDDLVDFSMQLPADYKVRGLRLRDFYKNSMADFLPRETIAKVKHGFSMPFGLWLAQSKALSDLVYGRLENLRSRGLFRPEFLTKLFAQHRSSDAAHYGKLIWLMVILELWFERHAASAANVEASLKSKSA